jgi:hypothetical protein
MKTSKYDRFLEREFNYNEASKEKSVLRFLDTLKTDTSSKKDVVQSMYYTEHMRDITEPKLIWGGYRMFTVHRFLSDNKDLFRLWLL